ncbi:uncharacterized protein HKW66_Vig0257200 [Vigna angularis]|uniref:Neprosin PEP catalytic domain-containing protein n=1 Tax=Phaseolus angularis TaxID=3914 RepID=A0A8T0JTC4_PHAAN|nr:uncharacterized protein HKW66_Vig0257200 [Vigna angularis]
MSCYVIGHVSFKVGGIQTILKEEDLDLERQLKLINKPPMKTINTKFGDIIDCIDIYKQPSFDHPLLKDHKLQRKPNFHNVIGKSSQPNLRSRSIFGLSKDECSKGTVPILRTTKDDRIREKSMLNNHILLEDLPGVHSDNYKKTGCYNIRCAGFVQTSKDYYLGARFTNVSRYGGPTMVSLLSITQTKFGDIIDCIDIYKQPSFDHPLLKDHKLQRKPNFHAVMGESSQRSLRTRSMFGLNKDECPKGTVPILRTTKDDLIWEKSILNNHILLEDLPGVHVAEVSPKPEFGPYFGVNGVNSVYNPRVDTKFQISMSHLWVQNGPIESTNKISLGWHVIPELYNDYGTHLYSSWTSDNYKKTGCYNIRCAGFVQTSKYHYLGARIASVSRYGGPTMMSFLSITQRKPNFHNVIGESSQKSLRTKSMFRLKKDECPKGTVPILRTTKDDLIREKSMLNNHILLQDIPGVHVIPELYNDYGTHLYSSWTSDNFKKTRCYNIRCAGFVQTSKDHYLGVRITNVSRYGGPTMASLLSITQDPLTKNWWLSVENKFIGYFPIKLFSNMNSADEVGWGGRTRTHLNSRSPQMGSGNFPNDDNFTHACYFKEVLIKDSSRRTHGIEADETQSLVDKRNCYNVRHSEGYTVYVLLFGGPGGNCGN